MSAPRNELERLLADPKKQGAESYPEMFRLLREATLIFLMPYHPEMMGTVTVKSGDTLPRFVVWQSKQDGNCIPVFTSIERANEACAAIGARDSQYALAEMNGKQLFDLLACQDQGVVINPACRTMRATFMDLAAVKALASGSILKPGKGPRKQGVAKIVDPADYPTDFLQPLFQFLRQRQEAKAAWLLEEVKPPGSPTCYVFVLQTSGITEKIHEEFRIVANSACPQDVDYGVTELDTQNVEMMKLTSKCQPFYAAPGWKTP